jgi:hypothetical protein
MFQCTRVKWRGQPKELTTCHSNADPLVLLFALEWERGAPGEDSTRQEMEGCRFSGLGVLHNGLDWQRLRSDSLPESTASNLLFETAVASSPLQEISGGRQKSAEFQWPSSCTICDKTALVRWDTATAHTK